MGLVNGVEYSWVNIRAMVAGIIVTGIAEISYKKKQEKVNNYGIGSMPVSRSYGIAEYEASITLHMSEVEAFTKVAPNRDITQIAPFDISIAFVEVLGRTPVTHNLRGCEFMENGRDMKEGDTKLQVKLDLIVADIEF